VTGNNYAVFPDIATTPVKMFVFNYGEEPLSAATKVGRATIDAIAFLEA
jgi:hypothetical protein